MAITHAQILNAITDTIAVSDGVRRAMSQAREQITESIPDLPLIQVIWWSSETSRGSETDRISFRAGIRHTEIVVHIDVYARQRSYAGEDLGKVIDLADSVYDTLETSTDIKPYFGLAGIQWVRWRADFATFRYGDPQTPFTGIQFTLTLGVF